jgi:uncharacterized protein YgfB (UPF0149 family)
MVQQNSPVRLPNYQTVNESIAVLALPISVSELHGMICGYLCAGNVDGGAAYVRALISNQKGQGSREAALALFGLLAVSHQQMSNFDFELQLLLPDDAEPLALRAEAFSEWCEGFTQGMTLAGVVAEQLAEEEAQEALRHLNEFAELDHHALTIDEEDERALMEVTEYARMSVLRLYNDLLTPDGSAETAH